MGLASELGYRYPEPNRLQRLVQWFASSRFGAWLTPKSARPATPAERTDILATAATKFAGAGNYEQRLQGRRPIPVVVLQTD